MAKSQLNQNIAHFESLGYVVYSKGSGTITNNPNSNLQRALDKCAKEHGEDRTDYVVGAKMQYKSQGRQFAVLYLPPMAEESHPAL